MAEVLQQYRQALSEGFKGISAVQCAAQNRSENSAPRKETATAAPANNAMASLFANAKQLKKR